MSQAFHRGKYPDDWHILAKRVKDDAGCRCVRCRCEHNPGIGRTMTVHHFDGDKGNSERWNLMALCQACHLSVQARVDPLVALLFEPSAWCIPYIVGFYESGRGFPGPLYDAAAWRARYEREVGAWPRWGWVDRAGGAGGAASPPAGSGEERTFQQWIGAGAPKL